ncbi:MAG: hypothetical protein L6Q66_05865 [Bacteroidia bacterium]|nr:hypothetical protein [Bacteroidia bacterium]
METNKKHQHDFFRLYDRFIKETQKGKRVQKNGKRVRASSIEPYIWLRKLLWDFSQEKKFPLYIYHVSNLKKRELSGVKKYWENFYKQFTDYLYTDLDCFDNYVGSNITRLRAFLNYLSKFKNINPGEYHKDFYSFDEEISIVTLTPEQLNFLITNKTFENSLPEYLKKTKDTFVFGCTVALRFSDIFKITPANIESISGSNYLKVRSQKTGTLTVAYLPDYAMDIINKRPEKQKTIFENISKSRFNRNVKELIERANWIAPTIKTRTKRGVEIQVYKNPKTKEEYRFCDLITSHTMRRTAITTMLCLNMPENLVRQISGHAPNSKEFFKYVHLSQKYIAEESEKIYEKLKQKELVSI